MLEDVEDLMNLLNKTPELDRLEPLSKQCYMEAHSRQEAETHELLVAAKSKGETKQACPDQPFST